MNLINPFKRPMGLSVPFFYLGSVTFSFCSKLFYFLCDSEVCKQAVKFSNYIMTISRVPLSIKVARQSSKINFPSLPCGKEQKEIECKICIKTILEL